MSAFRLARVLRLKEQLRRLRQSEAEAIASHATRLAEQRRDLGRRRERAAHDELCAAAAGITAAELVVSRAYDAALSARQVEVGQRQEETRIALLRKREEVSLERREERKFERLEELHRERETAREAAETERLLDELAGRGDSRRRGA